MRILCSLLALLGALLVARVAVAEAPSPAVPPALAPWIPWVLEQPERKQELCSQVDAAHVCVWPSALALEVDGNTARFSLQVTSEQAALVALPGSTEHWPLDVELAGQRVPVLDHGGPALLVARGEHTIRGRFAFAEPPSSLAIPEAVATLSLRVDGRPVLHPNRKQGGALWIREQGERAAAAGDDEPARLSLSVHRRIEDGVPLQVTTRLELVASGKPREALLDGLVLPGTRPVQLTANLPTQLAADGRLRLQVASGTYRVEVVAVAESSPAALTAPKLAAPWPDHEVWVFKADDQLRHVELAGAPQVDAARTDLSPDWHKLPSYLLAPGSSLQFETRRRGAPVGAPNRLTLARELWLDLDGDGYTVRDRIRGSMRQGHRLDLQAGLLGRAVVAGRDELITRHRGKAGIELRESTLDLTTEWRLEHARADLPAVGYDEDLESLTATLHVPPGYLLLAAQGVDQVRGTWLDRWDLFDFFFVLLVALAVAKLAGPGAGALALLMLVLTQHEADAPATTWILLLVGTALTRVLRHERWRSLGRAIFGLALVAHLLVFVPFAVDQVRSALYPHLRERGDQSFSRGKYLESAREESAVPAAAPAPTATESMRLEGEERGEGGATADGDDAKGSRKRVSRVAQAVTSKSLSYSAREIVDPNATVQTGPGVPTWDFDAFTLSWSGPVQRQERMHLWLAPPPLTRLWSLASLLLSALVLAILVRAARELRAPSIAAPLVLLLAGLAGNGSAAAQAPPMPDDALLEELRARLLQKPICHPDCLAVSTMELSTSGSRLEVRVELHAGDSAVYSAPGPLEQWPVDTIRIDGKEALAAARLDDDLLHVRVPAGVHTLLLSGPLPAAQSFSLALGAPAAHHVEARAQGWEIEGLHVDGSAEPTLSFRRQLRSAAQPPGGDDPDGALEPTEPGADARPQALVPWLLVTRELQLGLRFQLRTTVTRVGSASESVLVRLPLLPGESVNEAGLVADRAGVVINLPHGERSFEFVSTMPPQPLVTLQAAQPVVDGRLVHAYTERWRVQPSTLYRVRFEGIAATTQSDRAGRLEPMYQPWPGEKLAIHAERLPAAEGASVTIDSASVRFSPGERSEQSLLLVALRTSRGTTERLRVPADATLTALEVDGKPHPAPLKQGVLELPLDPGSHQVSVTLKRGAGWRFHYRPEPPHLGRAAANVRVEVNLPPDRWLLATAGPAWGPALLLWVYLVSVLLAALALGQISWSPLRSYQWALLGLGLTQVESLVALIVVAWLLALAHRARSPIVDNPTLFNLFQLVLVATTAVALGCLAYAVQRGLLAPPDMQMSGSHTLQWYVDRSGGKLPQVSVWSLPLWVYKALMLLWSLWLAASLLDWLRWGFHAFRQGGSFRREPARAAAARAEAPLSDDDDA